MRSAKRSACERPLWYGIMYYVVWKIAKNGSYRYSTRHHTVHVTTSGMERRPLLAEERRLSFGPAPEVLLILGGSRERELAAASTVTQLPLVRAVILSSGVLTQDELRTAVLEAGGSAQCAVDRSAVDTLTNFTSLVPTFAAAGVNSVAVATDRSHMRRAYALAFIVLGSCAIQVESVVANPMNAPPADPESWIRVIRDVLRALFWVMSGFDGQWLSGLIHPRRAADVRAWRRSKESGRDERFARWLKGALRDPG